MVGVAAFSVSIMQCGISVSHPLIVVIHGLHGSTKECDIRNRNSNTCIRTRMASLSRKLYEQILKMARYRGAKISYTSTVFHLKKELYKQMTYKEPGNLPDFHQSK